MNNAVKEIFVCSAARSGSTLLDMLLGQYDKVESLGEINFLGKSIARNEQCSCGVLVRDCQAWLDVFEVIKKEKGIDLLNQPYGMRYWDTRMDNANADFKQQTRMYLFRRAIRKVLATAHYLDILHRIIPLPPLLRKGLDHSFYTYELIRKQRGAEVVIDSSKEIYKAVSAYQRSPETVRLILMSRDGRGVMYSRLYSGVRTGESPEYAIRQWQKYYSQSLSLISRWVKPEHVKYVRYEEIAADPDKVVSELLRWIELDHVVKNPTKILHIAGGNDGTKTRFKKGVSVDERWRNGLSTDELELFNRLAGDLNIALGYRQ